ncbi:MAG TPA: polysaccharide biosynthesis/export family protein [Terriglobia bacterium]|nr:polysaccharide biosynthesis/export family protein [Terriglobia bacterium]
MGKFIKAVMGIACATALSLALAGRTRLSGQDLERIGPVPSTATSGTETQQARPTARKDSSESATNELSPDYVIGPQDVLQITVFDVPDLNQTVRVANDGTIGLPLLGRIEASGLTTDQLRDRLEKELGKNLVQNPQVSVFVQQYQARPVSIVGAVEKPGLYQITGPRSIIEMISLAGGLSKRNTGAPGKTVYVTRPGGFGNLKIVPGMTMLTPNKIGINLKDLLYTQAEGLNIRIEPRDIIAVSKAEVIYVAGGGVQKPGGFMLEDRDSVTVMQALAMAQGLAPNAARRRARIIHTKPDGSHVEKYIDVEKIISNKEPDPVMAANDILYVPSSRSKAAAKKTVETIVQTVSGFLILHP